MPIKEVEVKGNLYETFNEIEYKITYKNFDKERTLESIFEYPLSEKTLVKQIRIQIDGEEIEGKIFE